eukprot:COSAG02_NODE_15622_length_1154_cov_3.910900_1_plen_103_part_10
MLGEGNQRSEGEGEGKGGGWGYRCCVLLDTAQVSLNSCTGRTPLDSRLGARAAAAAAVWRVQFTKREPPPYSSPRALRSRAKSRDSPRARIPVATRRARQARA